MKRSPDVEAMLERCTLKGWWLKDPHYFSTQCQYCHAHIKNVFEIVHSLDGSRLYVGSECVKSFLPNVDGPASVAFFRAKWRQHRKVYWKRFQNRCAIVGPYDKWPGQWYCAVGASVTDHTTWTHATGGGRSWKKFASAQEAQRYVMIYLITGSAPRQR